MGTRGYSRPIDMAGLTALIQRRATDEPTELAVHAQDGQLTNLEVWKTACRVADDLTALTRDPGVVGLLTGRTRYSLAAFIGVQMSGHTALLLDEQHPTARLKEICAAAGASAVVANGQPSWADENLSVLDLSRSRDSDPGGQTSAVANEIAYVVFTSGTQGRPKGVEISRVGLDVFLNGLAEIPFPRTGNGLIAVSPAFDGWLWCLLLHSTLAQPIHLVDLRAEDLTAALNRIAPVTLSLTPTLLADAKHHIKSSVVISAGEKLGPRLAEDLAASHRVLNVYGPTETTIAATYADSARGDDVKTIGRPLTGYSVHLLDELHDPVPDGTVGEIAIGGPAVAVGYSLDPNTTASSFVTLRDHGRVYLTGDSGRRRGDGQLEFLGRRDDQVKVRGVRVELTEVETLARRHSAVETCGAFLSPDGESIGLGVVLHRSAGWVETLKALRQEYLEALPAALVPAAIFEVESLPVTDRGKVDRAALARLAEAHADDSLQFYRAQADVPDWLQQAWIELLGTGSVNPHDDFFDIGGHSLLAARLIARARAQTALSVTIRDLYANPTLIGFSEHLAQIARTVSP